MILLVKLILAHLIGDFLMQPKSWVHEKNQKKIGSEKLYRHVILHGILVLLLSGKLNYWPMALAIAMGHLIIDITKLYLQRDNTRTTWFIIDQVLHFVLIVAAWAYFSENTLQLGEWLGSESFIIHFTAIFFLTQPLSIILSVLMQPWSSSIPMEKDHSLVNAGKYIGILERVFVYGFIITNHWSGIGFLLAAKSVFRFGDLRQSKDRKLTEYILIGSLLSFGIATAVAVLAEYLLKLS
ncbi:MAG: DUF3307 domain-containing protein [Owenweeksia sp.]